MDKAARRAAKKRRQKERKREEKQRAEEEAKREKEEREQEEAANYESRPKTARYTKGGKTTLARQNDSFINKLEKQDSAGAKARAAKLAADWSLARLNPH